jgi:hypothetical protein
MARKKAAAAAPMLPLRAPSMAPARKPRAKKPKKPRAEKVAVKAYSRSYPKKK